jgi:hypothetical protein
MQHFNCPHCKKQIDVFDAGEAEREKLRLDEQAKKRAERLTEIKIALNRISGVSTPLEFTNNKNYHYNNYENQICVSDEKDGIIRDFESAELVKVFTHLISLFKESIESYDSKKFQRPFVFDNSQIISLAVDIDNCPCRLLMSYYFLKTGWITTIDTMIMPSWMDSPSML